MQILVVDDDQAVRDSLQRSLQYNGYEVSTAEDGLQALARLAANRPDAVIMDVMMPRLDGLEATRMLRAAGNDVPILVLTARDAVNDRVDGLDAGGDDYLAKPFALDELLARLRALVRRAGTIADSNDPSTQALTFSDLVLNTQTREVLRGTRAINLTRTEFALLEAFMHHPRRVLERSPGCSTRCGASTSRPRPTPSRSTSATCGARPRPTASRGCCTPSAGSATCSARRPRDLRPRDSRAAEVVRRFVRPLCARLAGPAAGEAAASLRSAGGLPGSPASRWRSPLPSTGIAGYFTLRLALYRTLDCELAEVAHSLARPVAGNIRNIGGLTEVTLRGRQPQLSPWSAPTVRSFVQGEQVHLRLGDEELAVARLHRAPSARSGIATDGGEYRIMTVPLDGSGQLRPCARPAAAGHQRHPHLALAVLVHLRRDRRRARRHRRQRRSPGRACDPSAS